ncbi:MAG: 4-hydroxythreonine-4-phosphate dehydrogenase, partial [Bacteroidaceae bacterium]|nr:4-hydroxythreonine-4-phosphate dehydrogenase [Bacteroidaceae bacterium]
MNDTRKIRVGITQGDINGIGYEIIFKAFSNPEMFDICTPVVYGSPKLAAYHRKALNMDISYNAVESVDEICDGKLNIINSNSDELLIELGTSTK